MIASAMPSLSCPDPRVHFQLMLFPVDKCKHSPVSFFVVVVVLGGEGRGGVVVKICD